MSDYNEILIALDQRNKDVESLLATLKSVQARLPTALEEAYCEGWADGSCASAIGIHNAEGGWENSETKAAVEIQAPEF